MQDLVLRMGIVTKAESRSIGARPIGYAIQNYPVLARVYPRFIHPLCGRRCLLARIKVVPRALSSLDEKGSFFLSQTEGEKRCKMYFKS